MLETFKNYWSHNPRAWWQLGICLAVVLFFVLLSRLVRYKIMPWALRLAQKREGRVLPVLLQGFSKPAPVMVWAMGIYLALRFLPLPIEWVLPLTAWLTQGLRILVICLLAWGLVGSSDIAPLMMKNVQGRLDVAMDKTVSNFLNKILKITVLTFAVLMVLEEMSFDVSSLIAGMGIVGLTLSLAAKESATNFFSGLVIVLERPFALGDWISVGSTEGTVEDIGFRSTKVRTLDNSVVVVPNTKICSDVLVNGTLRQKRLYRFTLGVTYDTTRAQLEALMQELRQMLGSNPEIDPESVTVRLQSFGGSSIDILVHCYVKYPDLANFLRVQEEMNLRIMDIMERLGVGFAFPSQSIYIEKQ